jgi:glycosyltransferase involved in cell wall biosynthesis
MDISCVVPTLNSGWSLAETLFSILNQKDCPVRVIVVDSGSQDNTLEVCKQFGVEVVYEPPGNMYRAINAGLRLCNTEWLTYTNSDDLWYSDAFHRLLSLGKAAQADLVYGICDWIDLHGRFLHSFNPPEPSQLRSFYRLGIQPFAQQVTVFRKRVFDCIGGFDEAYRHVADFDFYLRAYMAGCHFAYMPGAPVARFRLHAKQLSKNEGDLPTREVSLSVAKAGLSATLGDRLNFFLWRISNLGNYSVRVLRRNQLEGCLRLSSSMEPLLESFADSSVPRHNSTPKQ